MSKRRDSTRTSIQLITWRPEPPQPSGASSLRLRECIYSCIHCPGPVPGKQSLTLSVRRTSPRQSLRPQAPPWRLWREEVPQWQCASGDRLICRRKKTVVPKGFGILEFQNISRTRGSLHYTGTCQCFFSKLELPCVEFSNQWYPEFFWGGSWARCRLDFLNVLFDTLAVRVIMRNSESLASLHVLRHLKIFKPARF